MLLSQWIKILAKILFYLFLLVFFCQFYFIGQMRDFFRRRTTIASRREEVKALEPPTFTICLNPPFKASEYSGYKLNTPEDIFWNDFPNETLGQRFDKVSFKLGTDFNLSYNIELKGETDQGWLPLLKNDKYFEVLPIQTFFHGTCTKVQPRFSIFTVCPSSSSANFLLPCWS